MQDHDSRNWLSAYFDGELAVDERAASERRLSVDSTAHAELAEFRELGDLLRSLPAHELPAGFPAMVLERCERESLFAGDPSATHPAVAVRSNAAPQPARSGLAIVISVLATAAMLFLLVQVASPPGAAPRGDREPVNAATAQRPDRRPVDRDVATLESRKREADLKRDQPIADSTVPAAPFGATAKFSAKNQRSGAAPAVAAATSARSFTTPGNVVRQKRNDPPATGGAFPRPPGGEAGGRAGGGFGGAGSSRAMRFDFGNSPHGFRIGEVVPYLQVTGDRTAVIEVTVVDVNRAVGRLEVLLERKFVMPIARESHTAGLFKKSGAERKLLTLKAADGHKPSSELIAVYVESTQAQMAQVIQELNKETQSLHVSLRPPVALGDVQLKPNGNGWATLFRRDRRRPPRTLADAADFGRRTATDWERRNENGRRGGQSSKKGYRQADGVSKDDAEKSTRKDGFGKSTAGKKVAAADQPKSAPAVTLKATTKSDDKQTSNSSSFQLRLKLSEQPPAVRDQRDAAKTANTPPRRRTAPRPPTVRGPQKARSYAVPQNVQVIFVFRRPAEPHAPVPARRP